MNDLKGQVALVTGGSSGIGAAAVRLLAGCGADVVVGYNSGRERALDLIKSLPGSGHEAARISLTEAATINAAADIVKAKWGKLNILVNSAGFTKPIPHVDLNALSDEFFDELLISNVRGPFSVIRAFVPLLKAGKDSVIVNVSSISAKTGSGSNIAYCASKAALDTMTLSLARVLGPEIRVNCVSPGAVATEFVTGRGREQLAKIAEKSPLQRIVEPEDVARAVLALVTHLKATTGEQIIVDGGRHLG